MRICWCTIAVRNTLRFDAWFALSVLEGMIRFASAQFILAFAVGQALFTLLGVRAEGAQI